MNPDPFDPTLDALLRADSAEEPSPDVDAAILAAAHRAIQSGPREAAKPAEATSPWRWWMPFAAAATIGAITIGVLQLTPPEPQSTVTIEDRSEPPRVQSEAPPRAKVRAERLAPAPAAKNEADRAAEQGSAAGALAAPQTPQAAAPALAKRLAAADAQAMSPEQWIARIRALLNERKNEDAARELIAFRGAYADADARLPPDLQAWAATIKR